MPPGAEGLTAAQIQALQSGGGTPSRPPSSRKIGASIALTLVFAVLAAGAGAGARFGFDRMQPAPEVPVIEELSQLPALGEPLPTTPFERPSARYVDAVLFDSVQAVTLAVYIDMWTGDFDGAVRTAAPDGTTVDGEIAARGEALFVKDPASGTFVRSEADAMDIISGFRYTMLSLTDAVPARAVPFTTVLEEADGVAPPTSPMSVARLDPPFAALPNDLRYYRLLIDGAAFRAADPVAHVMWDFRLGLPPGAELELWVDPAGMVRRIEVDHPELTMVYELRQHREVPIRLLGPLWSADDVQGGG